MFKRLLVPLDGSRLAESVLPVATYLAERFSATIVLFHAVEAGASSTVHGQRHLLSADEAQAYLNEVAKSLSSTSAPIETNVHAGSALNVAQIIIDHVAELKADLVVLCAHGRGGWRDLVVGNIAQQVIQGGTTPVLFVRPGQADQAPSFSCRQILVPLDGTPIHEPALPVAAEIARVCHSTMHLLTVVPTLSTLSAERAGTALLLPTTVAAVLELAQRGAIEYLQSKAKEIMSDDLMVSTEVVRGDPATSILDGAKHVKADLIVMATHGRANIDAFWSGSVTPRVLFRSTTPVLLIRVTGEESAR